MSSTALPQSRAPGFGAAVSIRRFVDEEVALVASRFDANEGSQFEFLCECGELACRQTVSMTVAEYRASPGSVVGHPLPGGTTGEAPRLDAASLSTANAFILRNVRDADDGQQEWEFL
jgi:hypothetical protein